MGNHCNKSFKYIKMLLTMLLNVYITVADAAIIQRWSPRVLQCSNMTTTLQVILRLGTISSLLQLFRAPIFVLLSQTHSVLCNLLSFTTNTQIQDLSPQRQHMLHRVFCSGMQVWSKGKLKSSGVRIWFWIGFTFSHLSPKY